jgi:hypothetical protein
MESRRGVYSPLREVVILGPRGFFLRRHPDFTPQRGRQNGGQPPSTLPITQAVERASDVVRNVSRWAILTDLGVQGW